MFDIRMILNERDLNAKRHYAKEVLRRGSSPSVSEAIHHAGRGRWTTRLHLNGLPKQDIRQDGAPVLRVISA